MPGLQCQKLNISELSSESLEVPMQFFFIVRKLWGPWNGKGNLTVKSNHQPNAVTGISNVYSLRTSSAHPTAPMASWQWWGALWSLGERLAVFHFWKLTTSDDIMSLPWCKLQQQDSRQGGYILIVIKTMFKTHSLPFEGQSFSVC